MSNDILGGINNQFYEFKGFLVSTNNKYVAFYQYEIIQTLWGAFPNQQAQAKRDNKICLAAVPFP